MALVHGVLALLALLPAALTLANLRLYRPPPSGAAEPVSAIVPARDEQANIGACLQALRANAGCAEIVVVDDHSTDATAAIIAAHAAQDARVRRIVPPPLPPGWSGKPHACAAGAAAARHPVLLFIDADVRLAPDAVARLACGLRTERLALASAFPRELCRSLGETLLVPLIHVLLLGYLPFWMMRRSAAPGFAAGCGQVFVADAAAYRRIGGHGAVRRTWHDGVTLPRAFRAHGLMTGLFDGSDLARCRMYAGLAATWRGFSKNAREGLAKPAALPVWTLLLAGGFVLAPCAALLTGAPVLVAAVLLLAVARVVLGWRVGHSAPAMLLTPAGVLLMLVLQWRALLRRPGRPERWRGRVQTA
jgi:hypothetical protein